MATNNSRGLANLCTVLGICLALWVAGCATMLPAVPGEIRTNKSEFDGSVELTMEPQCIGSSWIPTAFLGLYKTSRMQSENIVLTAVVKGAHRFARGKSLLFNMDGGIVGFDSFDELTNIEFNPGHYSSIAHIPASNSSSKRYLIDRSFLKTILAAEKVIVKIELADTYLEDEFTGSFAYKAFEKFDKRIDSTFLAMTGK